MNKEIKNLLDVKYKTSRRKILRTSENTDSKDYAETKKETQNGAETNSDESLEKLYEIYGYYFCLSCGKKIPNIIDTCDECSKKENEDVTDNTLQNNSEEPEDVLEKLNEIFGYHFCSSCGKKIPNVMEICDECSKSDR